VDRQRRTGDCHVLLHRERNDNAASIMLGTTLVVVRIDRIVAIATKHKTDLPYAFTLPATNKVSISFSLVRAASMVENDDLSYYYAISKLRRESERDRATEREERVCATDRERDSLGSRSLPTPNPA
jgi:hypothetical protein